MEGMLYMQQRPKTFAADIENRHCATYNIAVILMGTDYLYSFMSSTVYGLFLYIFSSRYLTEII
jgi:hypothetical protein